MSSEADLATPSLPVFFRQQTRAMRNLISAPPNPLDVACPARIGVGDVLLTNHREKIVKGQCLEVTVEPPPVAAAKWIINRIVHDRDRKG
ncbi:MAG TPA: hypothetical protein VMU78_10715, partial [Methylocella sp.]|nr:hypothetical protein [Methylocella sp.]